MNTAAHSPCQTHVPREAAALLGMLAIAMSCLLACPAAESAPAEPPAWQRELDAARLAEATATLLLEDKPVEAVATDRRLGELYRKLAGKYPDQAAVRKAVGEHFWKTGDAATAISEWQAAQALDPADAETASALGTARLRNGQTEAARDQYQRAVDACPGDAAYHFDLANVLYLFRHELAGSAALPDEAAVFRAALAHYRRASELAAGNIEFARAYAETFYGLPAPDWAEGLAAWDHFRALAASQPDFANLQLARVSLRLEKPAQAEAYLDLIRDPNFEPVKETLHRQAERLKQKAAATPPAPGSGGRHSTQLGPQTIQIN